MSDRLIIAVIGNIAAARHGGVLYLARAWR